MAAGAHLTGAAGTAAAAAPRAAQRKLKRAQARARGRRRHQRRFRPATLPCVGGAPAAHSMGAGPAVEAAGARLPALTPGRGAGAPAAAPGAAAAAPGAATCTLRGQRRRRRRRSDRWSPPTRRLREPLAAFTVWWWPAERGAGARGHAVEPATAGLPVAVGPSHSARPPHALRRCSGAWESLAASSTTRQARQSWRQHAQSQSIPPAWRGMGQGSWCQVSGPGRRVWLLPAPHRRASLHSASAGGTRARPPAPAVGTIRCLLHQYPPATSAQTCC